MSRPSRRYSGPPSARPPFWWLPSSTGTPSLNRYEDEDENVSDSASALGKGVSMRRVLQSVMHGVVLALQSLVALAVLSVFVWITLWKNEDSEPAFWAWLWEIPSPALGSVLILCFATMVAHEIRVLSAVALLYLQAAILALTTATVMTMWVSCVGQESNVVKAILVGCSVFMWGMAALGFLRAAVVWRVDSMAEDEAHGRLLRGDGEAYGTF